MLYKVKNSDLPKIKQLIANAFYEDPFFNLISKDKSKQKELTKIVTDMYIEWTQGKIQILAPSASLQAVAIWANQKTSSKKSKHLLPHIKKILKTTNPLQLLKILFYLNKHDIINKSLTKSHDNYLLILAVDPKFKGKGLASKLLKPTLKELDKKKETACLVTNNKENIPIYNHYGFILLEESNVSKNVKAYKMSRKPKPNP